MVRLGLVSVVLALGGWLAPLAIADTVPPTPTIILEKATHFLSPSGEDVLIQPGSYEVEQAEEWIQIIPLGGGKTRCDFTRGQPSDPYRNSPGDLPPSN